MRKYEKKRCMNCYEYFIPTGAMSKWCEECAPFMRKKKQLECSKRNYERKKNMPKCKPSNNTFNEKSKMANAMGISYGKLQGMIFMGQM